MSETANSEVARLLARLDESDLARIREFWARWLAEQSGIDTLTPESAFIVGVAWATQWNWE